MGRQRGIIQLEGTMQGITFYKSGDGYLVRAKSSLDKARVQKDPAFEGSRRASTEFGRAGAAARLIRAAFRSTGAPAGDARVQGRLTGRLVKLMATDMLHPKGGRLVADCDLTQLTGFERNKAAPLAGLLRVPVAFTPDGGHGEMVARLPPLLPARDLAAPTGATHYEVMTGAAAIHFGNNRYTVAAAQTGWLALDNAAGEVVLRLAADAAVGQWLFAGAGIRFGSLVNGEVYPLDGGAFALGVCIKTGL